MLRALRLLPLALICISSSLLNAQEDKESTYALLWEISGKELAQPSYLFGSMHVRKGGAFNLPDSIRYCIEASTAFANEVHLDSAMIRMLDVYLGGVKPAVDADYLEALATIKVEDDFMPPRPKGQGGPSIWSSISRSVNRQKDTTSYPTFLDAYLMEFARAQGKRLYGLENIDEHLYDSEESGVGLSIFGTNLHQLEGHYFAGDIEEIGYLVAEEGPHFDQMALVPRNYIMLRSMMRILETEASLFTVVGAAHLPGKTGLIQLLKDEGYKLRPIQTDALSRRAASELLSHQAAPRNWTEHESSDGHYRFAFPFDQVFQRQFTASKQYLAYDIGRGLSYLLLTDRFLPYQYNDFETFFFTEDGFEIQDKQAITINGLPGTRYKLYRPEEDIAHHLGFVFFRNQQLFYLQVGAYEESVLADSINYEAFLDHLQVFDIQPDKWTMVDDTLGGFSVRLPRHYERIFTPRHELPEGPFGEVGAIYHAGFEDIKATTWALYGDLTSSPLSPESDRIKRQRAKGWLEEFLGATLEEMPSKQSYKDSCWTFSGTFYEDTNLSLQGKLIQRGNRFYAVISIDQEKPLFTKKMLPSFRLQSFQQQATSLPVKIDSALQVYLPTSADENFDSFDFSSLFSDTHTLPELQITTSTDPLTGTHFWVRTQQPSSLYGTADTSALLQDYLKALTEAYDSTAQLQFLEVAGFPGLSTRLYKKNSQLTYLAQVYIAQDRVIQKIAQASTEAATHPNIQAFFENDRWNAAFLGSPLLTSKSKQLLAALASSDADSIRIALQQISARQGLEASDADQLKEILLRTSWPEGVTATDALQPLLTYYHTLTDSMLSKIEHLYVKATTAQGLRSEILYWLGTHDAAAYWTVYFRVLLHHTVSEDHIMDEALLPLQGKTALLNSYWPKLLAKVQQQDHHPIFWKILALHPEEDAAQLSTLHEIATTYLQHFADHTSERPNTMQLEALLYCYTQLSATENMWPYLSQVMRTISQTKVCALALQARLQAGDVVKRREINRLLNTATLRYPTLRVLNRHPEAALMPKQYEEAALARYLLEEYWTSDTAIIKDIRLDQEITYRYKNSSYQAFVFTFTYEDDHNRLAVVGLFDQNSPYFIDEQWIATTDYTVSRRRRENKAREMLDRLKNK